MSDSTEFVWRIDDIYHLPRPKANGEIVRSVVGRKPLVKSEKTDYWSANTPQEIGVRLADAGGTISRRACLVLVDRYNRVGVVALTENNEIRVSTDGGTLMEVLSVGRPKWIEGLDLAQLRIVIETDAEIIVLETADVCHLGDGVYRLISIRRSES